MGELQYTHALQISKNVLRYAKVVELGLYVLDNLVDDGAIDGGLNKVHRHQRY